MNFPTCGRDHLGIGDGEGDGDSSSGRARNATTIVSAKIAKS